MRPLIVLMFALAINSRHLYGKRELIGQSESVNQNSGKVFGGAWEQNSTILDKFYQHKNNFTVSGVIEYPPVKKRSVSNSTEPKLMLQPDEESGCILKSELEAHKKLENVHLEDIKDELKNLQELVTLLRDQEFYINSIDQKKPARNRKMEEDQLVELLNYIKDNCQRKTRFKIPEPQKSDSQEELERLMDGFEHLKSLLENFTTEPPVRYSNGLEKRLDEQHDEIKELRKMLEHLATPLAANTSNETHGVEVLKSELSKLEDHLIKIKKRKNSQEIVGMALKKPPPLHFSARSANEDLKVRRGKILDDSFELDDSMEIKQKQLEKLERQITVMKKKQHQDSVSSQLKKLEKQIRLIKNDHEDVEIKSLDDDRVEDQMQKLQRELKKLNKKQGLQESKTLNDDLLDLQEAIGKLRPKDDFNFESKENDANRQFQQMMLNLFAQHNAQSNSFPPQFNQPQFNLPQSSQPQFNPAQIETFMKSLSQGYGYGRPGGSNQYPSNDYGYLAQYGGLNSYPNQPVQPSYPSAKQDQQFFRDQSYANPASSNPALSYNAPPQNSIPNDPYPKQKVEDLKGQIYNLQGVIGDLNRPEYTQKPEDKDTIYKLDQQISDLKNVINNLSQDSYVTNPPVQPPATYDKDKSYPPPAARSRFKRDDSNLMGQLSNFFQETFFNQGNEVPAEGRSLIGNKASELHQKLAELKKQTEDAPSP